MLPEVAVGYVWIVSLTRRPRVAEKELPVEREWTPYKSWLSNAMLAHFPTRPILVRLQTEHLSGRSDVLVRRF